MSEPGASRFFTAQTRPIFAAVAGCVIPAGDGGPGGDAEHVLEAADRAIAGRPARDQRLLAAFLRAIDALPLLRYGKRFTALPADKRAAFLRFLQDTRLLPPLRQGFFGVKTFVLLGYYGSPASFAQLRYPGPRLDAPFYVREGFAERT